jgi:hypothetical protein
MKKVLTLIFLSGAIFLKAQKTTVVSGTTLFVQEGTSVKFDALDVQGEVTVRAKTIETDVIIEGEITGDDKINLLGTLANINLDNCSWNVSNESEDTINDITLNSNARLVLEPGFGLMTNGDFVDQSALEPAIRIKADATGYSQLHLAGTYSDNGSGLASKETFVSADETWRQLGATMQETGGLSVSQWSDDIDLYFANDDPKLQNVFLWDGSPSGKSLPYQLDATGWVSSAANQQISATQAGAIYMGPSSVLYRINSNPITELGNIQTADLTYNLFYTEDDEEDKDNNSEPDDYELLGGWNLIHNSYTANISLTKLFDYGGTNAWPLAYPYVHVWDPVLGQYRALTNGGSVSSIIEYNNVPGNAVTAADATIAPGQAFWVKTIDATGLDESGNNEAFHEADPLLTTPLTISRSYLDIGGSPQNFFKKDPPHLRLGVINIQDSSFDQTVLLFDEAADFSGDRLDAFKLRSLDKAKPSLLSRANNGIAYAINALPNKEEEYHISVEFSSEAHMEHFYFRIDEAEIDPNWVVQVEDKILGQFHDLSGGGEFVFTHENALKTDRFIVHINALGHLLNSTSEFNRIVNLYGMQLSISQNMTKSYNLLIYDISGRLIITVLNLNRRNEKVDLSEIKSTAIVVVIQDASGSKSEKFMLQESE